ncbi:MAG: LCP family protein [Bacteroidetes bacterium]|nr:LCP family protein [Bacteroidota bacterium]
MRSHPEHTETHSGERPAGRVKRLFIISFRSLFWLFVFIGSWGLIASMIPSFPGPSAALRSGLHLAGSTGNEVYHWIRGDELAIAAKRVRDAAVEHRTADTTRSDVEALTEDRRRRLPIHPLREDSLLQSQLKQISDVPPVSGRLINILIIGIDSRLSARHARADALHLVTVNPDSAIVEIMSIPRDSYVDLGYPDTTHFNIIANAKMTGNKLLMRKVAGLCNRGPVNFYVEVGFSQAMGILEMLGYGDPVSTLQFLRTRRTLPGGDIQRAHNQALFMRQNLIDRFPLLTGVSGEVIVAAGLNFVTTNLSRDFCLGLLYNLDSKGFPHHREDAVRLRMLPGNHIRLRQMTADSATVIATLERVRGVRGGTDDAGLDVTAYLRRVYTRAMKDSTRPGQIIYRLRRLNEQHAWLQIQETHARKGIRDTLTGLLEFALREVGKTGEADEVRRAREAEDLLIRQQLLRQN